jgi:hypothetical protein
MCLIQLELLPLYTHPVKMITTDFQEKEETIKVGVSGLALLGFC